MKYLTLDVKQQTINILKENNGLLTFKIDTLTLVIYHFAKMNDNFSASDFKYRKLKFHTLNLMSESGD